MAVRNVAAIILAGGQGERLSVLSAQRAKPAVPFAGKYRIIDFTLSNCVNSGIYRVAVLTQYRPHSLNDHIGIDAVQSDHARHNVAPKVTFRASDASVFFQASDQHVAVEDVDAHADQVALGLRRLFVEA